MARATEMGLIAGGCGYSFVSTYPTKGCYTYSAGSCKDKVFYGLGGTAAQREAAVSGNKVRILCDSSSSSTSNDTSTNSSDTSASSGTSDAANARRIARIMERQQGDTLGLVALALAMSRIPACEPVVSDRSQTPTTECVDTLEAAVDGTKAEINGYITAIVILIVLCCASTCFCCCCGGDGKNARMGGRFGNRHEPLGLIQVKAQMVGIKIGS